MHPATKFACNKVGVDVLNVYKSAETKHTCTHITASIRHFMQDPSWHARYLCLNDLGLRRRQVARAPPGRGDAFACIVPVF